MCGTGLPLLPSLVSCLLPPARYIKTVIPSGSALQQLHCSSCKQGLDQTTQDQCGTNKSVGGVSAYGSRLHGTVAKINEHKEGT